MLTRFMSSAIYSVNTFAHLLAKVTIPYLPMWKVRCKLLTEAAWDYRWVVLGLERDPCKWYLELPTALGQLAPITPIELVGEKKKKKFQQRLYSLRFAC